MVNEKILQLLKQIKELSVGDNFKENLLKQDIESLHPFLKRHNLEHFLFDILQKNFVEESKLFEHAKQKKKKAVFKSILQQQAIDKILNVLDKAEISYILLKGAVIKNLYFEPWLRTSDDIDILIKPHDLKKTEQVAKNAGFKIDSRSTHDVSFIDENKIRIEIHYDLIEKNYAKKANNVLSKVWESAEKINENRYEYQLTDAMMYFYHIAHLAKHFELGGCGVRAILDTVLLNEIDFDKEKREKLLLDGGLDVFATKIESLAKIWFLEEKSEDKDVEVIAQYIVRGGNFGSFSNFVQAQKAKEKQTLLRLFFPNKSDMEKLFPPVKKCVLFLPVFWMVRIFIKIFKGNNILSVKKIKSIIFQDDTKTKNATEFFKSIGL